MSRQFLISLLLSYSLDQDTHNRLRSNRFLMHPHQVGQSKASATSQTNPLFTDLSAGVLLRTSSVELHDFGDPDFVELQ